MKKFLVFVLAVLVLPGAVFASEFGQGPTYTWPAGKNVQGSLYAAGGTLYVNGGVGEDLLLAGGNIFISGSTTDDLMAAGGSVALNAPIGSDARVAGGNVSINAPLGGELLAAGGELLLGPNAIVGQDAYLAGNNIVIDGAILGKTEIFGQQVTINGTLGRDVTVRAQKIVVGPKATIGGNLIYQAAEKAQIANTAQIAGETRFTPISAPERYSWGKTIAMLGFTWLLKLVAILVAVLVMLFVWPKAGLAVAEMGTLNFWTELLRGLIILIITPVALFILLLSLVGWFLAVLGLFAYIFLLLLAAPMSVFVAAGLLQKYFFKQAMAEINWLKLLLSTVVLFVIGLIPFVGWVIALGIYLAALGATARWQYSLFRR